MHYRFTCLNISRNFSVFDKILPQGWATGFVCSGFPSFALLCSSKVERHTEFTSTNINPSLNIESVCINYFVSEMLRGEQPTKWIWNKSGSKINLSSILLRFSREREELLGLLFVWWFFKGNFGSTLQLNWVWWSFDFETFLLARRRRKEGKKGSRDFFYSKLLSFLFCLHKLQLCWSILWLLWRVMWTRLVNKLPVRVAMHH